MFARVARVPPDPVAVAHRVAARCPDVALLHAGRSSISYVAAYADAVSHALDPHDPSEASAGAWGGIPRWIGVIPYECRRTLERPAWRDDDRRAAPILATPAWRRFPAVARIDREKGDVIVVGDDADVVARLLEAVASEPAGSVSVTCALDDVPDPDAHLRRVARARELILDGDLYQVNVARRFGFSVDGAGAGAMLTLYERAVAGAPSRFGAVLVLPEASVISLSPELLLRAEPKNDGLGRLQTEPIKGTRPRGRDAAADAALARELDADPKERAELAMIIDVERNDLHSVCQLGSVRIVEPPHVVTHQTVHHRQALLEGTAREDVSRAQIVCAMVPSGSVTGAPKVRAMEVIAELEDERRGLYTGGIGYVARDGGITLSMAIRTLVVRERRGFYWTGGGIVADSEPERELLETEWKAGRLFQALGTR